MWLISETNWLAFDVNNSGFGMFKLQILLEAKTSVPWNIRISNGIPILQIDGFWWIWGQCKAISNYCWKKKKINNLELGLPHFYGLGRFFFFFFQIKIPCRKNYSLFFYWNSNQLSILNCQYQSSVVSCQQRYDCIHLLLKLRHCSKSIRSQFG